MAVGALAVAAADSGGVEAGGRGLPELVIDEDVLEEGLAERGGAGDVLAVDEDTAGAQQVVDLPVDAALEVVLQVMNGVAGEDGVERGREARGPRKF